MTVEEIITIVVGLAGTWLGWSLVRKWKRGKTSAGTTTEEPRATTARVVAEAVDAIADRYGDAVEEIEAAEDSPTPATDAADILSRRVRTPEDE